MKKKNLTQLKSKIQNIELVSQKKVGEAPTQPYLSLYRLQLQNSYIDNTQSEPYTYDAVLRKWLDAVVIVLYSKHENNTLVCLRSSIRPPLLLRHKRPTPLNENAPLILWELPAGLIESDDIGTDGILNRAKLETHEETGYILDPSDFTLEHSAPFVSPGIIPERMFYCYAKIDDIHQREIPIGDGSPIEENATIEWVHIQDALLMCQNGQIEDMKTELGLFRLMQLLKKA